MQCRGGLAQQGQNRKLELEPYVSSSISFGQGAIHIRVRGGLKVLHTFFGNTDAGFNIERNSSAWFHLRA